MPVRPVVRVDGVLFRSYRIFTLGVKS